MKPQNTITGKLRLILFQESADDGRKHKVKYFYEHLKRTDFIVPRQIQSYAIHMGGDALLRHSILATIRNFDGDDPIPTRHISKEKITPKFGRSLRSKNPKNAHYIGADEANHSRVIGGLNASQGNLAHADVSVSQLTDTDLHIYLRQHAESAGRGSALELNENLSRPDNNQRSTLAVFSGNTPHFINASSG